LRESEILERREFQMSWFVVTTCRPIVFKRVDGAYHCIVFDDLVAANFVPYLPRYRKTFYKGRHRQWEPEPLFGPRYIFVCFDEYWPEVCNVRGVCSVLKPDVDLIRKLRSKNSKNNVIILSFLIDDAVIAKWKATEKDGYYGAGARMRATLIELAASSGIRIVTSHHTS
jgi:hypothetical protein